MFKALAPGASACAKKCINNAIIFVGLVASLGAQAADIRLLDQNSKPVANAVVSFMVKESASPTAAQTAAKTEIMDQIDFLFHPTVLVVQKDQWVSFPNSYNVRHHVYSFSSPKTFEIKMYKGSESKAIQFSNAGVVVLGCNIHDSMIGYIYVQDQELALKSDQNGRVSLDLSIAKHKDNKQLQISIWHPQLSVSQSERISYTIDPLQQNEHLIKLDFVIPNEADKAASKGFGKRFGKGGDS